MSELDKCKFYHKRVMKGEREPQSSYQRFTAVEAFKEKVRRRARDGNYIHQPDEFIDDGFRVTIKS